MPEEASEIPWSWNCGRLWTIDLGNWTRIFQKSKKGLLLTTVHSIQPLCLPVFKTTSCYVEIRCWLWCDFNSIGERCSCPNLGNLHEDKSISHQHYMENTSNFSFGEKSVQKILHTFLNREISSLSHGLSLQWPFWSLGDITTVLW